MPPKNRRSMGTVLTDALPQRLSSSTTRPSRPTSTTKKSKIPSTSGAKRSSSANAPWSVSAFVGSTKKTPRSVSGHRTPIGQRNALAPLSMNSANRHSVVGSSRGSMIGSQSQKDTRPIHDKEWQHRTRDELIAFCQANEYPHQWLNRKDFPLDTNKFKAMFEFLYRFLSPDFVLPPSQQWKQFIPDLLKKLGYSGSVSGSTFQTLGSLHSWPTVLAVLHFLLTLAKHATFANDNIISSAFAADDDDENLGSTSRPTVELAMFNFFVESYNKYNAGIDDFGDEFEQLGYDLMAAHDFNPEDVEQLRADVERLKAEYADLQIDPHQVANLEHNSSGIARDVEKMETYLKKLQLSYEDKVNDAEAAKSRIEGLKAKVVDLEGAIVELEAICRSKGVDWRETASTDYALSHLKHQIETKKAERDEAERKKGKAEMALARVHARIDDARRGFNLNLIGFNEPNASMNASRMEHLELDSAGSNVEYVRDSLQTIQRSLRAEHSAKANELADVKRRVQDVKRAKEKALVDLEKAKKANVEAANAKAKTTEEIKAADDMLTRQISETRDEIMALAQVNMTVGKGLSKKKTALVDAERALNEADEHFKAVQVEGEQLIMSTREKMARTKAADLAARDKVKAQLEEAIKARTQRYREATKTVEEKLAALPKLEDIK